MGGSGDMSYEDAVKEENRRIRRLRLMVDLVFQRLHQDPNMSYLEALELVEKCREAALALFPGKEATFELVYRPRFERVMAIRWPHRLPEEVGDSLVLGDPTGEP
ncbi:MAG: hypothetical protein R3199_08800 [Gemmatimonadota bacterium]|nr:hypothetical protein [Gemmatimonadota bacterium]